MRVKAPYVCDGCGRPKEESNHWHLRYVESPRFELARWDTKEAERDGVEHICSEQCASKALSKWMGEQKPIALREPLDPLDGDWAKAEGR